MGVCVSNECISNSRCRLCDVVHSEKKLTLVFEYSDQDLKKYFDSCNGEIDPDIVKVSRARCTSVNLSYAIIILGLVCIASCVLKSLRTCVLQRSRN